jgi:signal transduction histidine kinase
MGWDISGVKEQQMKDNTLVFIISVAICLLAIISCWYYLNRTLNKISLIITTFISKGRMEDTDVADTRESKLISQLKQLIKITDYEVKSSKEERETVNKLVSDLSHQLKTPLANITMYSELLKDQTLSEVEKQEFVIRTGEQAAKMEWLMQTLLKTSRLETGMIEFDITPTFIKETIANSISAVYGQAERKNIRITTEEFVDRKLLHNPKWTTEAIVNILENAIKYSSENTVILIRIERMEFYTKIQISDQGIGILQEEFNLIFKRFFRSKQVEQKEGSGLGLYLSQLILSKEGGYITVDSKLGMGSCFSLFLQNVRES